MAAALLALLCGASLAQARFAGIGREATPAEVAAWDIDVRPDFKGLPPGSGSVARGQVVWEAKCAQCHGVFGEAVSVFNPLIGGTTAEDVKTGKVARLNDPAYPGRTTMMKLSTVSTLWDYINRAMPWTQPKSLSVEEVYSVTAFMLNLAHVVPDDFVLSDSNIAQVQARMPNRNGMSTQHALWPGPGFAQPGTHRAADTRNTPCMSNCAAEARVASILPDFARNAHGNLAGQNRLVGPQRGADTLQPAREKAQAVAPPAALAIAQKNNCTACHAANQRILGPSFAEIALRHAGKAEYLAGKIVSGGSGVWGAVPMPPQAISADDAKTLGAWLAAGAGQ